MTSAPTSESKTGPPDGEPNGFAVVVATRGEGPDRQFLLVRHRRRGWELPGGSIEAHEGPVHCALREFREETGHILQEPRFVLKRDDGGRVCYVFTGGLGPKVAEIRENEDIESLRWHSRLPPPDHLAFPDDPYDEIGEHLSIRFR